MPKQYLIRLVSNDTIVARFSAKAFADQWMLENNTDPETGETLNLFRVTKG